MTGSVGERIMEELMGAPYLERRAQARNGFNDALQDYSQEVCFGRIWARPGIDRKTRSMLNLAMLTALNRPNQLAHHVEGALNNGCSVEEIKEILLQAAVYCGLPAAADAFKIAEKILADQGLINPR
jgi:4-carboxymuconolactone decarboxylase